MRGASPRRSATMRIIGLANPCPEALSFERLEVKRTFAVSAGQVDSGDNGLKRRQQFTQSLRRAKAEIRRAGEKPRLPQG